MRIAIGAGVAVGALLTASGAQSADQAPPTVFKTPPLPVLSWTGCFVGGQVGAGRGRNTVEESHQFTDRTSITSPVIVSTSSSGNLDTDGAVFGGQIGCDYQSQHNWVVGIQGSALWSGLSGTDVDPLDPTNTIGVSTGWIYSLTGRFGYVLDSRFLAYVRGGAAWTNYQFNLQNAAVDFGAGDVSQSRSGWTAGGGLEYLLSPRWSVFVEYNHYDFGSENLASFLPVVCASCTEANSIRAGQTIDTVTAGVNYHFNPEAFAIRYAP